MMNRELTPFEALQDLICFIGSGEIADTHELREYVAKRRDIISNALNLQTKYDVLETEYFELRRRMLKCDEVKQKKLKALEIIKEKRVDVCWIMEMKNKTLKDYNETHVYELTHGEFDLLKEVLLCDQQ